MKIKGEKMRLKIIYAFVLMVLLQTPIYAANLLYSTGFETESSISEIFYTGNYDYGWPSDHMAIVNNTSHSGSKSLRGNTWGGACASGEYIDPITGLSAAKAAYLNIGAKGSGDWGTSHSIYSGTGKLYVSYWIRYDSGANFERSTIHTWPDGSSAPDGWPEGGLCTNGSEAGQYKMLYFSNKNGMNILYLNQGLSWTNLYDGRYQLHESTDGFGHESVNNGTWHHYEVFIQMESPIGTGNNGILKVWRDGVLKYTKTNMNFSCATLNDTGCGSTGGTGYTSMHFIQYTFCPCGSSGWQLDDIQVWDNLPSGGDITPPWTEQWSPAKSSTGVLKTNRTITFHVRDDVNVLTANGVVNIEGTNYTCSSGLSCTGNGTSDVSVTYTKGSDWSYDQVVNVSTSGFRDTVGNIMSADTWSYTIEPSPGVSPPNITTTTLPDMVVGTYATTQLTATGGTTPYTWSILSGSLPGGVTLSSSGVRSGTPDNVATTFNFTVKVLDALGQTDNQALSQVVNAATPGGQYSVKLASAQLQDTFVRSEGGSTVNYSADNVIKLYTCELGTPCNRIIMRWDLSSLPDNISITAATLSMYFSQFEPNTNGGTASYNAYVYRMTTPTPVIGTVTWATYNGTDNWISGGTNAMGVYESVTAINQTFDWKTWNVLNSARGGYTDGKVLYLALDSGGDHSWSNREFISENAGNDFGPTLSITYTQLTGPGGPSISAPGKLRVTKMIGTFR